MSRLEEYRDRYRYVRFERQDGILQLTIHHESGPAKWTSDPQGIHAELGDAFYQVGRDRENRVVIFTGTGDEFIAGLHPPMAPPEIATAAYWDRLYKEGKDLIHNLLDIEVPIIGAVNGPAFVHAELPVMSDLVLASDRATFADKAHFALGAVPGDGTHVWWTMLLGPNRGRQFLLTGEEIGANEAKALGFVAEVVPHERLLVRAREIARQWAAYDTHVLRYTRVALTQHIKRRMLDDLGYGLQLEGLGISSMYGR
jgi:enoyl-CoA hydratase/carnithine racemase